MVTLFSRYFHIISHVQTFTGYTPRTHIRITPLTPLHSHTHAGLHSGGRERDDGYVVTGRDDDVADVRHER